MIFRARTRWREQPTTSKSRLCMYHPRTSKRHLPCVSNADKDNSATQGDEPGCEAQRRSRSRAKTRLCFECVLDVILNGEGVGSRCIALDDSTVATDKELCCHATPRATWESEPSVVGDNYGEDARSGREGVPKFHLMSEPSCPATERGRARSAAFHGAQSGLLGRTSSPFCSLRYL